MTLSEFLDFPEMNEVEFDDLINITIDITIFQPRKSPDGSDPPGDFVFFRENSAKTGRFFTRNDFQL